MNKMRALHLLFYFSFLNTLCESDFFSSELSKFGDGHYYMKTDLDLKAYIHFFYNKISFINQPSIFCSYHYKDVYKNKQSTSLQVNNKNINAYECAEIIKLKETNFIYKFYNLLDIKDRFFCNELLIFSSKLVKEQYSLPNEIFKSKQMSQMIGIVGDGNSPLMYFGGIPQSILSKYEYHSSCRINDKSPNWECMLNDIYFVNSDNYQIKIEFNKYAIIDIGTNTINVPINIMFLIAEKLFDPYIEKQICRYYREKDSKAFHYFQCKCSIRSILTNFFFDIEGTTFIMNSSELFYESEEDKNLCNFVFTNNAINNNLILGSPFLEGLVSVYDYDNQQIEFYTKYKLAIKGNKMKGSLIKTLLTILICELILICVLLTINEKIEIEKIEKKKRKKFAFTFYYD